VFASGLTLAFAERYEDGVLDTLRFDPGGEATFVGDRFKGNNFELEMAHRVGPAQTVGFSAVASTIDFDDDRREAGFFDVDSTYVRVFGRHQRNATRMVFWEVGVGEADLERPLGSGVEIRERQSVRVGGVLSVRPSSGNELSAVLSWADDDFSDVTKGRTSVFDGVVGSVDYATSVPARPRLGVSFLRNVLPSAYLDNQYYVSDQLSVRLESPSGARLRLGGRVAYFRNDYPESFPRRVDDILGGRVWLGYVLGAGMEWRVYVTQVSRDSTLPEFHPITGARVSSVDYEVTNYGVELKIGR
jgi:hypothetical protein